MKKISRTTACFILCCLAFIFITVNFRFVIARGPSMEPTISEMDALLCKRKVFRKPAVGDLVVVYKEDLGYSVVKRIAAVPGERVVITNDNSAITYDYWGEDSLPDDCFFVVGDNPDHSLDSRDPDFGIVRDDEIKSYVIHIFHR